MKKLNLSLGSLKDKLTNEEMKQIMGGYTKECTLTCENGEKYSIYNCGDGELAHILCDKVNSDPGECECIYI